MLSFFEYFFFSLEEIVMPENASFFRIVMLKLWCSYWISDIIISFLCTYQILTPLLVYWVCNYFVLVLHCGFVPNLFEWNGNLSAQICGFGNQALYDGRQRNKAHFHVLFLICFLSEVQKSSSVCSFSESRTKSEIRVSCMSSVYRGDSW